MQLWPALDRMVFRHIYDEIQSLQPFDGPRPSTSCIVELSRRSRQTGSTRRELSWLFIRRDGCLLPDRCRFLHLSKFCWPASSGMRVITIQLPGSLQATAPYIHRRRQIARWLLTAIVNPSCLLACLRRLAAAAAPLLTFDASPSLDPFSSPRPSIPLSSSVADDALRHPQ
ncbi:hypothetical protein LZ30DRAFT_99584 [Colletotrichum cereale]|nr:hypothetical protein LZ30DRAFT_99584 [Colletotrichum cereale]